MMETLAPAVPGLVGYGLIALAVTLVVIAIALCARWLVRPGEEAPTHIKRLVLRDEQ